MRIFEYPKQAAVVLRALSYDPQESVELEQRVREIIEAVRTRGDRALVEFAAKFDQTKLSARSLRLPVEALAAAWESLPRPLQSALRLAKQRIEKFHRPQLLKGYVMHERGTRLEHRVSPLRRVGVYVPGGKAAYPSTVLMNVVPARVAGVEEIALVSPARGREGISPALLGAAWLAGVKEVYPIGGAQAVAALAFGTATIPRVDKVVGPGNAYVAMAKRLLFGIIDIDMIAGPSEVLVIADETAEPRLVAADMLAQAEHDESASAVALVIGKKYRIEKLVDELKAQTDRAPRRAVIAASLKNNGVIVRVPDRKTAVELANLKAPEHLEVMTRNPRELAAQLRNVGSLFVGAWTPEPLGDYIAGPNHTLPTSGTARFASPLGVRDFLKESQVLEFDEKAFRKLAGATCRLAQTEGLFAHAEAVKLRMKKKRD